MDGLTGEEAAMVALVREFTDGDVEPVVRGVEGRPGLLRRAGR
ncbi:MAG TPA: hypothetical protein VF070_00880 [Streptosporangiaceae bacterium]